MPVSGTHLFGVHTFTVSAPIETVAGVLIHGYFVIGGGKLIDRAQHDFTLQLLDRHAVLDEVIREIFE